MRTEDEFVAAFRDVLLAIAIHMRADTAPVVVQSMRQAFDDNALRRQASRLEAEDCAAQKYDEILRRAYRWLNQPVPKADASATGKNGATSNNRVEAK